MPAKKPLLRIVREAPPLIAVAVVTFVLLSMPGPEPAPAQAATQQKVLATLQSTRR